MRCLAGLLVRSTFVVTLSILLPALVGCGGSGAIPAGKPVPVKGKVTYNGKPVPAGCVITFFHAERNYPASGEITADGTYTLLFNGKPAVPEGTYKVAVAPPAGAAASAASTNPSDPDAYKAMMMKSAIAKGSGPAQTVTIPKKYATPETSGVTFTVTESQTAYDLDLKD